MAEGAIPPIVIQVIGDSRGIFETLEAVKAEVADFAKTEASAKLGANIDEFGLVMAVARKQLENFDTTVASAKLSADWAEAVTNTELATNLLWKFSEMTATATLTAEWADVLAAVDTADVDLADYGKKTYQAQLSATLDPLLGVLSAATAALVAWADHTYEVRLDATIEPLEAAFTEGDLLMQKWSGKQATAKALLNITQARQGFVDLDTLGTLFNDATFTAEAALSTGEAKEQLAELFTEAVATKEAVEALDTDLDVGVDFSAIDALIAEFNALEAQLAKIAREGHEFEFAPFSFVHSIEEADAYLKAWSEDPVLKAVLIDQFPLIAGLESSTAMLQAFAKQEYDAHLGVDDTEAVAKIAGLEALMAAAGHVDMWHLNFDPAAIASTLAQVDEALNPSGDMTGAIGSFLKGLEEPGSIGEWIQGLSADLSALRPDSAALDAYTAEFLADMATMDAAAKSVKTELSGPISGQYMLDILPAEAELGKMRVELAAFARQAQSLKLDVATSDVFAKIAEIQALLAKPMSIEVDANLTRAFAELEAFMAAARADKATVDVSAALGGGSVAKAAAERGIFSGLLGDLTGGGGGGGGGGGRGFGGLLPGGIPGVAALGATFGSAFGSIGSLAGFGVEHLFATAGGVAASDIGGLLGGGILAGTGAAVAGVGAATDLAGIGQAAGDAKTYTADLNALTSAQQLYGQSSIQAAAAQQQLNNDMAGLSAAALASVKALSAAGQAFHTAFDKYTSPAEAIGGDILTQGVGVAQKFLPDIGKYATENMKTIQSGLQPLFSWLDSKSGGFAVFNTLETQFQKTLPTALHAFTQGVELLGKTLAAIAPQTGHLIDLIDKWLTKTNSPTGFKKWIDDLDKLIGLFRTWSAFWKVLFEDIFKLGGLTAGLGKGIAQELTSYLQTAHKALESTTKDSNLGDFFRLHKQEMTELIALAVQFGSLFGKAYIQAAPYILAVTVQILKLVDALLKLVESIPGGGEFIGFAFLASRLGILSPLLLGLSGNAEKSAGIITRAFAGLGKITGLQTLISNIGKGLSGLASSSFSGLGLAFKDILGVGRDGEASSGLVGMFDTIRLKGMYAAQSVKGAFSDLFSKLKDEGGFITIPGLKGGDDSALSRMKSDVANFVTGATGNLAAYAGNVHKYLFTSVNEDGSKAEGLFRRLANEVKGDTGAMVTAVSQFAKDIAKGAKGVLISVGEMAASFLGLEIESETLNAVLGASVLGALILLGLAVVELVKHLGFLRAIFVVAIVGAIGLAAAFWAIDAVPIVALVAAIGLAIVALIAGLIYLGEHWHDIWEGIDDVIHAAEVVIGAVFSAVGTAAVALWHVIESVWGSISRFFSSFGPKILGFFAGAANWLVKTGEDIIGGLIHGLITAPLTGIEDVGKHIIGAFRTALSWFSEPAWSIQAGTDIMSGVAGGLQSGSAAPIAAAKNISQQIINAFSSLGGVGKASQAVSGLKSIFGNLGHVFDTIGTTAKSSANVGANITAISLALKSLEGALATGLVSNLNAAAKALSGLTKNDSLTQMQKEVGNLGHLFDTFGTTASSAAKVTVSGFQAIQTAITLTVLAAPGLISGINQMTQTFFQFANTCTAGGQTVNTQLGNIATTLNKLTGVFNAFGALASSASKLTSLGMLAILSSLNQLNSFLPSLMSTLEKTTTDFGKFHSWKALFGDLNNLMVLFGKLGQVFTDIGKSSSDANQVTTPALSNITTAVGNVAKALQAIPGDVFAINGPTVSTLQALVNNMLSILNSPATIGRFNTAGEDMMKGLQAGINSAAAGVATASAQAATNALNSAKTATKTSSPSLLYDQLGQDWMLGLVQGIHKQSRAVQTAVTGVRPTLNPASIPGVQGGHSMVVNATFQIQAPGGNPAAIKKAIEVDSAKQFADATLTSMRAGAGTVYGN